MNRNDLERQFAHNKIKVELQIPTTDGGDDQQQIQPGEFGGIPPDPHKSLEIEKSQ